MDKEKLKKLKRPICWIKGHSWQMVLVHKVCRRCKKDEPLTSKEYEMLLEERNYDE